MTESSVDKLTLRREAQRRRAALTDRDERSRRIQQRLATSERYREAALVLFHVGVRNEVRTRPLLDEALATGRAIAVPLCVEGRLELVRLASADELVTGSFGIPEPAPRLHADPARRIRPTEPDLILVPGVAYDRRGRRLGHGHGYYDRLLADVAPSARLVGLAFDCQIVERVPSESHDRPVHHIVTESEWIDCGRNPAPST